MSKRLIRIFAGIFDPQETKAFNYQAGKHQHKAVGVMFSHDTALSLSFQNNMSLTTSRLEFAYKNEALLTPPGDRIFTIEEDLKNCKVITGTVENLKNVHQGGAKKIINIYLLVEEA